MCMRYVVIDRNSIDPGIPLQDVELVPHSHNAGLEANAVRLTGPEWQA